MGKAFTAGLLRRAPRLGAAQRGQRAGRDNMRAALVRQCVLQVKGEGQCGVQEHSWSSRYRSAVGEGASQCRMRANALRLLAGCADRRAPSRVTLHET